MGKAPPSERSEPYVSVVVVVVVVGEREYATRSRSN